jgi:hypothetical protein
LFFTAAADVEPTPKKGSKTKSFSFVNAKISLSTNSIGNWHGWIVFSIWLFFTLGISHISLGFYLMGYKKILQFLVP